MGNRNSTISVVMTTYNGTRFLKEQLDSIRDQTLPPDEVLILDDCSTDGTQQLVQDYMDTNHLATWRLIVNETNVGWRQNFKNGFDLAQGDLIFPADQDDIWHPDKIERMSQVMNVHPEMALLASDYHMFVTGSDQRLDVYQAHMTNDGSIERISISPRWFYNLRPGCTYCFRKALYWEIMENWQPRFAHDEFLWRFACMKGGLYLFHDELIEFRRHGDNASSVFQWTRENRIEDNDSFMWYHAYAIEHCSVADQTMLQRCMLFLQMRDDVLSRRQIWKWPILLIRYHEHYITRLGVFADLVYALR